MEDPSQQRCSGVHEAAAYADTAIDACRGGQDGPAPRWQGSSLDHFDVEERIGCGAMGEVYLGHDRSLDREVAIKILREGAAGPGELQRRFVREARAQARLRSAHVAHIYHIGRTPADGDGKSALYFAMEHVPGGSLEQLLARGETLPAERARRLLIEAATGLRDARRAGVVHRDIKPGNLLLDAEGSLKIADFGVAKSLGELAITGTGTVLGSPHYMAPEQAMGEEADHRADVYALGCTFYHLLAGEPPFDGPSAAAVAIKHVRERPQPLAEAASTVPALLAAVIDRMMAREPGDRFQTHEQLIAALEAAAPAKVQPAGFWARAAAAAIDALVAGLAVTLIGWPALVLWLLAMVAAHARYGCFIGKHLLRLRVVRLDGSSLGWARTALRTLVCLWLPFLVALVTLLSGGVGRLIGVVDRMQPAELDALRSLATAVIVGNAVLSVLYFAGLLLAALHPDKRAAHDLVAGTRVVYRLPA